MKISWWRPAVPPPLSVPNRSAAHARCLSITIVFTSARHPASAVTFAPGPCRRAVSVSVSAGLCRCRRAGVGVGPGGRRLGRGRYCYLSALRAGHLTTVRVGNNSRTRREEHRRAASRTACPQPNTAPRYHPLGPDRSLGVTTAL